MTRCCAGPFGAVSPFDAPSWLTAEPRTTARIWWPLRRASDNRSTTSTPTPSDHEVPSADAEKDLHRPSFDMARWREKSRNTVVAGITVTPAASASEHSPDRSDCAAMCSVTSDDEHAVSIVMAGP